MTGAERLEQVRAAREFLAERLETPRTILAGGVSPAVQVSAETWVIVERLLQASAALAPCVVLTPEEAARVVLALRNRKEHSVWTDQGAAYGGAALEREALALLTPEGSDDDDPYPENPGPFGTNPGEC